MKQYLHLLDYAVWIAITILLGLIFFLSSRRGLGKLLPRYLTFIGFVAGEQIALVLISAFSSYPAYFWTFYAGLAVETILLLAVLHEIFYQTFAPLESLPAQTIARLLSAIAVIVTATLAWAIWNPASHPNFPWYADVLSTLNRSAGVVAACSLWSVVMYARSLGIPWRSRTAGIARGFLLYLSVQAFTTTATGFAGPAGTMWLNRAAMIAYLAAVIMWVRAVRQEEVRAALPAPESLARLQLFVAEMRGALRKAQAAPAPHVAGRESAE